MTSAFSWKTLLVFALLHSIFQGQTACYSRCFLTSYFCIPVPYDDEGIFLVLVLEGVESFQRTGELQLLQHYGLGVIDLDYCDVEWFALETNRDHSIIFEIAPSTEFWILLLTVRATPFLLKDSRPQW